VLRKCWRASLGWPTTHDDLQQSLLEGVALQTREVVAALGRRVALGDVLRVDGGLPSSRYFVQFLADVTGMTALRSGNAELTAYGCALLAGAAPVANPGESINACCDAATRQSWIGRYRQACAVSIALGK
jgi:glycerol kinase